MGARSIGCLAEHIGIIVCLVELSIINPSCDYVFKGSVQMDLQIDDLVHDCQRAGDSSLAQNHRYMLSFLDTDIDAGGWNPSSWKKRSHLSYTDGLGQDCSISSVLAMEIIRIHYTLMW